MGMGSLFITAAAAAAAPIMPPAPEGEPATVELLEEGYGVPVAGLWFGLCMRGWNGVATPPAAGNAVVVVALLLLEAAARERKFSGKNGW